MVAACREVSLDNLLILMIVDFELGLSASMIAKSSSRFFSCPAGRYRLDEECSNGLGGANIGCP